MIHLQASALPRILACLGSVALVAAIIRVPNDESESAREGTAAHEAAEHALKGQPIPDVATNGVTIDADMREHAAAYANLCATVETAPAGYWLETNCSWLATSTIQIGCKLDVAWYDPQANVLYIRDFKYGWRLVDPEGNFQLISYAIGLLRKLTEGGLMLPFPDDVTIDLSIFQPRPYHSQGPLRAVRMTLPELIAAHDELVAALAELPSDALATGDWCDYCPAGQAIKCPAWLAATGNAIDVAMSGTAVELPAEKIGKELVTIMRAAEVLAQQVEWLKDTAKRALKADGASVPGWALEVQKGNTAWTIKPEDLTQLTNVDILAPAKLVTPAEAKRRGVSDEVITANTVRPVIGEKLVRRDPDAFVRKKLGKPKKDKAAPTAKPV